MNGLLLVDKPKDITSHDVVGRVRRCLRQKTVGHTGTLDPMATGLMVLVLGEATKLSDFLTFSEKVYRLKARLGVTTDTLDRTGQILTRQPVDLAEGKIREAVMSLMGTFQWPVPVFSAAKVAGKKLYEYGRESIPVQLPSKEMQFCDPQIHHVTMDSVELTVRCSKGSFVRTWAAQLGEVLGVGGHLEELRRLEVGSYLLDQAVTLESLEANLAVIDAQSGPFIPISETLPGWRSIRVPSKEERLLQNGQIPRDLANRLIVEQKEALRSGQPIGVKVISSCGELISILVAQPGAGLKIRRVFRLDQDPSSH